MTICRRHRLQLWLPSAQGVVVIETRTNVKTGVSTTYYIVDEKALLLRVRYPRFVAVAKEAYGDHVCKRSVAGVAKWPL